MKSPSRRLVLLVTLIFLVVAQGSLFAVSKTVPELRSFVLGCGAFAIIDLVIEISKEYREGK